MNGTPAIADSRGPAHREGFTLIELILVVTLVLVISSAVLPIYNGSLKRTHADYALRDIIALVKYAQERAVTDSTHYRFYVHPENRQYWLMALTDVDGERMFEEVTEKQCAKRTLSEHLQLAAPEALEDADLEARFIEFFPNGTCDVGQVQLTDAENRQIRINMAGKLGQIEVEER